ncbi:MAG: hypothetical protein KAG61_01505 [Bacteriovoracaceae bacterium]|nr:hypothetical protein [Bacteriovoracaceae bacterium]
MKVALIGSGKTGGKVLDLLPREDVTVFNESNPVTTEALAGIDIAICFIPGDQFLSIAPILIAAKIPVVTGSTGVEFPHSLKNEVKKNELKWIHGHNFALGMNLIHQMIKVLSKADKLFEQKSFHIHEVHHTQKLDSPSGTAISWGDWLGEKCTISSDRIGDVIGDHTIELKTETEAISLSHRALDRKVFAKGALWAANKLLTDNSIPTGISRFEDIARGELA